MEKPVRYDYSPWIILVAFAVLPAFGLAAFSIGVYLVESKHVFGGCLVITTGLLILLVSSLGTLRCARIVVDEDGIGAYLFSRRLKFIRWSDIVTVKKVRRWNAGAHTFKDDFYIFDMDYNGIEERIVNLVGPIMISDKIYNLRELLNNINVFSEKYGFSLSEINQETFWETPTGSETKPSLRKVFTKVPEVRLVKL